MNKTITSQEAILCAGKEIVLEKGLQGLNIRDVARRCGVSVGSIYNYFPTKSDLIVATIKYVGKKLCMVIKSVKTNITLLTSFNLCFLIFKKF